MKNKKGWSIIWVILVMTSLIFWGCGKERNIETELFYRQDICELSQIKETEGFDYYDVVADAGRDAKAYFLLDTYYDEEREWLFYQIEGEEVLQTFSMEVSEDDDVKAFDVDSKGNCYLLKMKYEGENIYLYLNQIDSHNQEIREIRLDDWVDEYDMVNMIQLDKADNIYLFFESGKISVFSMDMEWKYDITTHQEEYILDVARLKDGNVIFASTKYEGDKEVLKIYQIDKENQSTTEIMNLKAEEYKSDILMHGDSKYDYYVRGTRGISGGQLKKNQLTLILRWEATDLIEDEIGKIYTLLDEKWFAIDQTDNPSLIYIVKGKEESKKEREILHMACIEAESDIRKEVADFNKINQDYQIEIISYSEMENPSQGLMMDLATRKDIDIVLMPLTGADQLMAKNVFIDLYPLIDKDQELKKEDFFENLLQAYEVNGKLYQTVSWVHFSGWVTKKSNLERVNGWNIDSFKTLLDNNPNMAVYADASSESILKQFLQVTTVDLIDWEQKTCAFDSEMFRQLLETAKEYGISNTNIEQEDEIKGLIDDRLLFSKSTIRPEEIMLYDDALSGDYVIVASPFQEGSGVVVYTSSPQLGIVAKSSHQEGAWQFVRRFFTKKYQDISNDVLLMGATYVGLPTRKDCFDDLLRRYTATEAYEKDGEWYEAYECDIGTPIYDFIASPMTKEQEIILRELVTGTKKRMMVDGQIEDIVLEEGKRYFAGDKSLDETVEIIQKRVQTYVNENR